MKPSGYTGIDDYGREPGSNGLLFDSQGRLTLCEHGDRRVSVLTERGGKRTLADNYRGKRFNSPNDLVYATNGNLYFTDPIYGLPDRQNDSRREMDYCGVYLLRPGGEVVLLTKDFTRPNGIGLSPDEKMLYVAQSDSAAPIWRSYPIKNDGTLGRGKYFSTRCRTRPMGWEIRTEWRSIRMEIFGRRVQGAFIFSRQTEICLDVLKRASIPAIAPGAMMAQHST